MLQSRSFRPQSATDRPSYRTPSPPLSEHIEPLSPVFAQPHPLDPRQNGTTPTAFSTYHSSSNPASQFQNGHDYSLSLTSIKRPRPEQSSALDALATLATSPTFSNGAFGAIPPSTFATEPWVASHQPTPVALPTKLPADDDLDTRPSKRARSEAPTRHIGQAAMGVDSSRPATSYIQQNAWSANTNGEAPHALGEKNTKKTIVMEDVNLLLDFSRGKVLTDDTPAADIPPLQPLVKDQENSTVGLGLVLASIDSTVVSSSRIDAGLIDHDHLPSTAASSSTSNEVSAPLTQEIKEAEVVAKIKKESRGNRGWPKGVPRGSKAKKKSTAEHSTSNRNIKNQTLQNTTQSSVPPAKKIRRAKGKAGLQNSHQTKLPSKRIDLPLPDRGHDLSAFHTRLSNLGLLSSTDDLSIAPRGRSAPEPLEVGHSLSTSKISSTKTNSFNPIDISASALAPNGSSDFIYKRNQRSASAPVIFSDEDLAHYSIAKDVKQVSTAMQRSNSAPGDTRWSSRTPGVYQGGSSEDIEGVNYTKCAGCLLVQNSLGEGEEVETLSWIRCDGCKKWFHMACAGLTENQMRTVDKFSCRECWKKFGPTTYVRKSARAHTSIDYAGLNEGLIKTSSENPDHPYIKPLKERTLKFLPDDLPRLQPSEASMENLSKPGFFTRPLLIPADWNPRPESSPNTEAAIAAMQPDSDESVVLPLPVATIRRWFEAGAFKNDVPNQGEDGLGMVIPSDLTVRRVSILYGPDEKVEVIDVKTQGEAGPFTMRKWADYYESKQKKLIRNVISLEISCSYLGRLIKRPDSVRQMDLADSVWPRELRAKGDWPKVQSYCLMSVADSFTDFHIDFGGSSVFYHILKGKKTFLFIPPKPKHLKKYEQWCLSPAQNQTFLPDQTKECMRIDLSEGDTMLIPSGWIHAVWTPEDSLVIGGNFLTRFHYAMQIQVFEIEKATRVPQKFRHPHFQRIMWYTAIRYMDDDPTPERVTEQLHNGQQFIRQNLDDSADSTKLEDANLASTQDLSDQQIINQSDTDLEASYQLLQEARKAQEKSYPQPELDGLHDLCRYLLRTALIVTGKITDGITIETRARVGRAIPKGFGEPLDIMKRFAVWIAWKRGNEHIPEWAYPEYEFEVSVPGTTQKLNTAALKKLERDASQAAKRRNPVRNTPRIDPDSLTPSNIKRAACESCRKRRIRCLHAIEVTELVAPDGEPGENNKDSKAEATATTDSSSLKQSISTTPKRVEQGVSPGSKPVKSRACEDCRKSKRRCLHDENGGIDEVKAQAALEAKSQNKRQRQSDGDKTSGTPKAKKLKPSPAKSESAGQPRPRRASDASTIILDGQKPENGLSVASHLAKTNQPSIAAQPTSAVSGAANHATVEETNTPQIETSKTSLEPKVEVLIEPMLAEPVSSPLVHASDSTNQQGSDDHHMMAEASTAPETSEVIPEITTPSKQIKDFKVLIPTRNSNVALPPTPQLNSTSKPRTDVSASKPVEMPPQSSPLSPPMTHSEHEDSGPSSSRSTVSPSEAVAASNSSVTGFTHTPAMTPNRTIPTPRRSSRTAAQASESELGKLSGSATRASQTVPSKGKSKTSKSSEKVPTSEAFNSRKRKSIEPLPASIKRRSITPAGLAKVRAMTTTSARSSPEKKRTASTTPAETDDEASLRLAKELSGVEFGLRRRG